MAWERNFEKKILKVREKELKYQKLNYTIEVSPLLQLGWFYLLIELRRSFGISSGIRMRNRQQLKYSS